MRDGLCRLAIALAIGGCAAAAPGGDPAAAGGAVALPSCGTITTREGVGAPVLGERGLGPDPAPRQVRLSLVDDPRTTIAVAWRTGDDATIGTTVRYGQAALDQTATGATFLVPSATGGRPIRMHEARLCGLAPDTSYRYQVGARGGDGVERFSPVFAFRTAPDPAREPDAEVVIAVLGDSRGGWDVLRQVSTQLAGYAPDLVLFTGDAVSLGTLQGDWDRFFDAIGPLVERAPMISAHGNHELNAPSYYAEQALPGDEENFAVDAGFAHVTVLNDSPFTFTTLGGATRAFLARDLAASAGARWKIVMHHRAIWSASTVHGSTPMLRAAWGSLYDAARVDLVLNGHDHAYERTRPMRSLLPQPGAADGTTYVVFGGAGAPLYDVARNFWTAYSETTHGGMILRVRRDRLVAEAIRADGTLLDSFTMTKAPP
ncbi:MAG: metallophosphoesterase family protein [Deltaproteobacteria bacterium]|nr:metallophosphoesterase family protein [Deltaproteobacteria bacterium]